MMIAPTRPQNSITVCQSRHFGARRGDAGARAPEIIVDDHDVLPPQLPRWFRKAVLTPPAFVIVQHLVSGRLTNVDEGTARHVIRRDLGHHRSPCTLPPPRSRSTVPRPNEASPSAGRAALEPVLCLARRDPDAALQASPSLTASSQFE